MSSATFIISLPAWPSLRCVVTATPFCSAFFSALPRAVCPSFSSRESMISQVLSIGNDEKRPVSTTYTTCSAAFQTFASSSAHTSAVSLIPDPSIATSILPNMVYPENSLLYNLFLRNKNLFHNVHGRGPFYDSCNRIAAVAHIGATRVKNKKCRRCPFPDRKIMIEKCGTRNCGPDKEGRLQFIDISGECQFGKHIRLHNHDVVSAEEEPAA